MEDDSFDLLYGPYPKYHHTWDGESNCPFRYSVSGLGGQNYNHQELKTNVKLRFLISNSDPDIIDWDILITGKPSANFREELGRRLTSGRVPSAIQNEAVQCIFDKVGSCEAFGVRALITLLIFHHQDEDDETDEELGMVVELSMQDSETN